MSNSDSRGSDDSRGDRSRSALGRSFQRIGPVWNRGSATDRPRGFAGSSIVRRPGSPQFPAQSGTCRECEQLRASTGDPSALCATHLRVATG